MSRINEMTAHSCTRKGAASTKSGQSTDCATKLDILSLERLEVVKKVFQKILIENC